MTSSSCTCEKPVESPNPRQPGYCLRCCHQILEPKPPPRYENCKRCGHPVDVHGSYVIGYHKAAAEMDWVYICESCEVGLRSFLGIVPL